MAIEPRTEPWLREIDLGVHPALAQPVFALQQAREDLHYYTVGLTEEQVWLSPNGLTPLGFHLRHIAGSTARLTTYLLGEQLTETQLLELKQEKIPGPSREELLIALNVAFDRTEKVLLTFDESKLQEPRYIGRKRIRTTAGNLAIHIGEHAQRHTGQAITTCHILRRR